MNDCPRFNNWFGACKFEPRYDEPQSRRFGFDPAAWAWMTTTFTIDGKTVSLKDLPDTTPVKKYIHDVCIRCGKVAKRT